MPGEILLIIVIMGTIIFIVIAMPIAMLVQIASLKNMVRELDKKINSLSRNTKDTSPEKSEESSSSSDIPLSTLIAEEPLCQESDDVSAENVSTIPIQEPQETPPIAASTSDVSETEKVKQEPPQEIPKTEAAAAVVADSISEEKIIAEKVERMKALFDEKKLEREANIAKRRNAKKHSDPAPAAASVPVASEPAVSNEAVNKINDVADEIGQRTLNVMMKIWNWVCVGEEYRSPGVSREYAIATTWLVRIGIVILLFGIGFFLKYSIDRNWINPAIRVVMMIVAGLALVSGGVYSSRTKYRPLGIALAGGGFVTLYLSIMAAYKLYGLISVTPAFAIMCIITIAAMVVSVGMNALLGAMIACVGGYLTPVFVSTGSENIVALLVYFTVLGAGTLFVAKYKDWILLNVSALLLYCIIGYVARTDYVNIENVFVVTLLMAANFILFALQLPMASSKKGVTIIELLMMTLNIVYFLIPAIAYAKEYSAEQFKLPAVITLFTSFIMFVLFMAVRKYRSSDLAVKIYLITASSSILALTIPLLLDGKWIVCGWALMALSFIYGAVKTRSRTLFVIGSLLYVLTFFKLFFPYGMRIYMGEKTYWQSLFDHLMTYGVYIISILLSGLIMLTKEAKKLFPEPPKNEILNDMSYEESEFNRAAGYSGIVFSVIAALMFFACSSYELVKFSDEFMKSYGCGIIISWWSLIALVLVMLYVYYRQKFLFPIACLILLITVAYGVLSPKPYLTNPSYGVAFLLHFITYGFYIAVMIISGIIMLRCAKSTSDDSERLATPEQIRSSAYMFFTIGGVFFGIYSSWEIRNALVEYLFEFRNGGVSVWWGVAAFVLLVFGIKYGIKALRMTAIGLFVACAFKIFFIDLAGLEQIWRIVAFIVIGIIMLVGALLYIRFKDSFKDNEHLETQKDGE